VGTTSLTNDEQASRGLSRTDLVVPVSLALLKLAIHLVYNRWYGYHHDELYFLACGKHLSFGYVDHAPIVPWIARLSDEVFGQSLVGLRLFPAVAGPAAVFLTGLLTRRLGGGRFAQAVACVGMLIAPMYLRTGNALTIPSFEPLFWVLCSYLIVRIVQEDNPRLWIWVGIVAGIGLMTKHTMGLFGFGLVVGLLLTRERRQFKAPWLYAGGAVALLIFLPNLVWQIANGWPTVEFVRDLNKDIMSGISLGQFFFGQVLYLHPFNVPVWLAGLCLFLLTPAGKPYSVLGWIYVSVCVLLILTKSKIYYLGPAYPALLAGGGLAFERFVSGRNRTWMKPATIGALAAGGIALAPVSLPIFHVDVADRYCRVVTLGKLGNIYEITGDLHGQFGWKERVEAIAEVYHALPDDEKPHTAIYSDDYGNAGAVDYFGEAYGLPNAVSGSMTYHLWGIPDHPVDVVLAVDVDADDLGSVFDDVQLARRIELDNVNPWDREFDIYACRRPKKPLREIWPQTKRL